MKTDIEIAQASSMQKISALAKEKLNIDDLHLEPYGHYKAKISLEYLSSLESRASGKLILVTAISPTPAGEGKTTTSVGLNDALNHIGKKSIVCLREPSIGPVFGMKGGAAGGGYSQVVPMEDINLHFTGDFHAIQVAHNLLAALIDNHIHHGNLLQFDLRRITWRRVLDVNDRALREIVQSLGGTANGFPRESGFDIVVASEVMAILCLSSSLEELKEKLGNIICGFSLSQKPITARDLKAHGAMSVLLKEAMKPNLVQTLERNPAIIHGGPFANIAHGCNSVIATKAALKLADYVVTEAGFGADLGAEKFIDIKCRKANLKPDAVVVVATLRALKFHGGADPKLLAQENREAVHKGLSNLHKHIHNMTKEFGLPCVVALNHFATDTDAEFSIVKESVQSQWGLQVIKAKHWELGGPGAVNLAEAVVEILEKKSKNSQNQNPQKESLQFLYPDQLGIFEKIKAICTKIYAAGEVTADSKVLSQIKKIEEMGFGHVPVCIAKTQYSFSTDPALKGAPQGHSVHVREVRLAAGAEFVVAICGDIMTMPGLPKTPAAEKIDLTAEGKVLGLF